MGGGQFVGGRSFAAVVVNDFLANELDALVRMHTYGPMAIFAEAVGSQLGALLQGQADELQTRAASAEELALFAAAAQIRVYSMVVGYDYGGRAVPRSAPIPALLPGLPMPNPFAEQLAEFESQKAQFLALAMLLAGEGEGPLFEGLQNACKAKK